MLAELFAGAVAQHRSGALVEAERRYRYILTLFPDHADSLQNLGLIALQGGDAAAAVTLIGKAIKIRNDIAEYHYNIASAFRVLGRSDDVAAHLERAIALRGDYAHAHLNLGNVRREQGRLDDALACYERALALDPKSPLARRNLADVLFEQRRLDAAIESYRQALALDPAQAEAHKGCAIALMAQGKAAEAVAHFERALALNPDVPGTHEELAKAYMATGRPNLAVHAAGCALERGESDQAKSYFAHCAKFVRFTSDEDGRYRRLMLRALAEGWARPRDLAAVSIGLIKLNPVISEAIARTEAAWPSRLSDSELFGASGIGVLSEDQLLRALLECDPVTNIGLEHLLTNARRAMLMSAAQDAGDENLLALYCALARQCFINDYVFSITGAEAEDAQRLRASLEAVLADGASCPAHWPAVVGAYYPLHALQRADCLLERAWPPCVEAVIIQQVKEPAEEHRIAATIPVITAIDDDISRAVRQQYEENPYPRWVKAGPPGRPAILNDVRPNQVADVLIAGCGTGLSTIELAREIRHARILAIDLSLASLSYAKRMAQDLALDHVEFAQADILHLATLGRQFDFIDASGVLHHLGDLWQGWRVLLSLLRPNGAMQVALYSKRARENIVAARALIDEHGYRPTVDDIRRCREEITATEEGSLLKSIMRWEDFFTTNECRDLLFHVQEHRVDLPEIKAFLTANDLQFVGFNLDARTLQRFAARFPAPPALTDLDCWHVFESEAPMTFASMYQFWLRKRAA